MGGIRNQRRRQGKGSDHEIQRIVGGCVSACGLFGVRPAEHGDDHRHGERPAGRGDSRRVGRGQERLDECAFHGGDERRRPLYGARSGRGRIRSFGGERGVQARGAQRLDAAGQPDRPRGFATRDRPGDRDHRGYRRSAAGRYRRRHARRGDRAPAGERPADQRPQRPGADAAHRRRHLQLRADQLRVRRPRHSAFVDLDQRQSELDERADARRQQQHPQLRRRGGRASGRRCGGGVQGAERHDVVGVRLHGGRRDQSGDPLGRQRDSRHGLLVFAQRQAGRAQHVLQQQAAAALQPVRRHDRRAVRQEPHLRLLQLGGVPPAPQQSAHPQRAHRRLQAGRLQPAAQRRGKIDSDLRPGDDAAQPGGQRRRARPVPRQPGARSALRPGRAQRDSLVSRAEQDAEQRQYVHPELPGRPGQERQLGAVEHEDRPPLQRQEFDFFPLFAGAAPAFRQRRLHRPQRRPQPQRRPDQPQRRHFRHAHVFADADQQLARGPQPPAFHLRDGRRVPRLRPADRPARQRARGSGAADQRQPLSDDRGGGRWASAAR